MLDLCADGLQQPIALRELRLDRVLLCKTLRDDLLLLRLVAMQYLGTPYVWGGASPGGFDCSGLVMYAFQQVGISLPHSSYAQYGAGVSVSRDQLQPGDLVFFDGLGHVGIYVGGGSFIHAPHTGDVVKISSMTGWYASSYVGARRIL